MRAKVLFNDLSRQTNTMMAELNAASGRVISSGWYILGSENEHFEKEFAAFCDAKYAVGVANGSDALELALKTIGITEGDAVATVANAGGYTTVAIRSVGARPVFVDVKLETQLMDLAQLEEIVAKQPIAAVCVTHLYGRMVDMEKVAEICGQRKIKIIEDCAQSHGAKLNGRVAGSFGAIGCFSFYPTKNLGALGDSGALITNDPEFMERAQSLRQYGWKGKYRVMASGGRNSRLDEIQAAFLRTKLPFLEEWNKRRRVIADRYRTGIKNPKVETPPEAGDEYVAHLYVVRSKEREGLRKHLQGLGIGCDVHYPVPDHQQMGWVEPAMPVVSLPVTERLAAEIISLPCYPELEDNEVEAVIQAVNTW